MNNCIWCAKARKAVGGKKFIAQDDMKYMTTFILGPEEAPDANVHLVGIERERPGIGNEDLINATDLRRWVHDLRWAGLGVIQCVDSDEYDKSMEQAATGRNPDEKN